MSCVIKPTLLFSSSHSCQAFLFLLGTPIVLAVNTTPFLPPQSVGSPGSMVTMCLSQDLFDSALLLLQKAGALNMDITGQLVRPVLEPHFPTWGLLLLSLCAPEALWGN